MIDRIVNGWSDTGDVVLDPFMGSGTTAIACINNNRKFIGFELDEYYCNLANERIEKHTKQMGIFTLQE